MSQLIESLAQSPELIVGMAGVVIGGVVLITLISYIFSTVVRTQRETEQSRREIAAYVAEGNLSPDDAERLLAPAPWYARSARHAGVRLWNAANGGGGGGGGCCGGHGGEPKA